jgi:hypothetical protein
MKRIFFIVCLFVAMVSFAKKWDAVYINSLISKGEIDKVIQYYQNKYYGAERDPQDAFKIADLYVKKKDYANAMQWYDKEKQLLNTSKANLLNYANTNRLMGEYQKALDGYLLYAANTGDAAKVENWVSQCEKILKLSSQSANYKIDNYSFNTNNDEINVASQRTNIVYFKLAKGKGDKVNYTINQIVRNYEGFAEPIAAYKNNIPNLIITSISYSKDGNTVVFSAKDEKELTKGNIKNNEKIYIAENLGGTFLNAKPLTFNEAAYIFKNPSFNDDGTVIYFSSNRTGGSGGFDIWKSTLVKDKWSTPTNLGKLVNSKFDEINPFLVQDKSENTLYFSSNRDGGFGGFDIYTVKKSSDNIWQNIELQPAPINSSADDISIVYDDDVRTSYFSSNRINGKGGYDIYRCTPFALKIIINAKDSITEQSLDYVFAQLNDDENNTIEGVTNENGKLVFLVGKDKNFTVNISKSNYKPTALHINTNGKSNGDSVEINALLKKDPNYNLSNGSSGELSMQNSIVFTGQVIDNATSKPATSAKMRMLNYATQKVRELKLDKDGKFEIKLLTNNNYRIIFENQSNKIIDELTTYGLENNDVKVRDYILTGSKFKLSNNRVYKNGNIPDNIKLSSEIDPNNTIKSSVTNQPITQAKIDSLLKVISNDNESYQTYKDTTSNANKQKESQLIVVGPKDKAAKKSATTITRKVDTETQLLAADIAPTSKNKKVNVIKEESDSIEIKIVEFDIDAFGNELVDETNKNEQPAINKVDSLAEAIKTIKDTTDINVPKVKTTSEVDETEDAETAAAKKAKALKQSKTVTVNEIDDDLENAKNKSKTIKSPKVKSTTTSTDEVEEDVESADAIKAKAAKQAKTTATATTDDAETAKNKATTTTTSKVKSSTISTDELVEDVETADAIKAKAVKQAKTTATNASDDAETAKNKATTTTTSKVKSTTTDEVVEDVESADALKVKAVKQAKATATNASDDAEAAKNKATTITTPKVKSSTITTDEVVEDVESADALKAKAVKQAKSTTTNVSDDVEASKNKATTTTTPKVKSTSKTFDIETTEATNTTQKNAKSNSSIDKINSVGNSDFVLTKSNQNITNNTEEQLPDLYYKIQIASYKENNLTFPEFDNIGKVEMVSSYDRYIYRLGNYTDFEQAKQILEKVREQGYFVAFILMYNKDKVKGVIK